MTKEKKTPREIPDSWLYLSIIILGAYFIIRLINQAKMAYIFPFDYTNDYSSHMAQLYFLGKCGFHNACNYWYNGYELLKSYPPSWFFFTGFTFVKLTGNILLSTYLSVLAMFGLCFATIYLFGKKFKLSVAKRITFFLFLLVNPITVGNFIRLGRVPEFMGWVIFLPIAFMLLWYKDRKFDKKFLFFIPLYFLLMISNPFVIILTHLLLLGFFLIKPWRERLILIGCGAVGAILASFWWLPYLLNMMNNWIMTAARSVRMWDFSGAWLLTNIAGMLIPLALWVIFYLYLKNKKFKKRELLFFSPILIVSILFFFRLIPFVPVLKHIYPDGFLFFFLFFAIFYLFQIRTISSKIRKLILVALLLVPIIALSVSLVHTPWFNDSKDPIAEETVSLFPKIPQEGRYIITTCFEEGCCKSPSCRIPALYSYAPIFHNISTAGGYSPEENPPYYIERFMETMVLNKSLSCENYLQNLDFLNTTHVISYVSYCDYLKDCGLEEVESKENACLYKITERNN